MQITISQRYAKTEKLAVTAKTCTARDLSPQCLAQQRSRRSSRLYVLDSTELATGDCRNANCCDDQQVKGRAADLEQTAAGTRKIGRGKAKAVAIVEGPRSPEYISFLSSSMT